ncbi:TPM domain-containing protein ['Paenibacillus yunnanensis' Narsing Rao et al. 2020]|uniref:TPM domain-containing protein n=1 Tax=Paenibacillus tengchongensis TaxID=2608684 RepID=UPI00124C13EA|nr:TPM domain-containing protein [Paenibacillus tengchongensis]
MRKYFSLFLLLSLLWIPAAYAADIPARQGLITDTAGMLTRQERTALEAAASGEHYTVHVLTVDSLNGRSPADYAGDAAEAWNLGGRDVLLLISAGDSSVELNVDNNSLLQSGINAWARANGGTAGSDAITRLLDTYFIPYAREGDFAGGISSLMEKLQTFGSGNQSSPGTSTGTANGSSSRGGSALPMLGIGAGVLILGGVLFIAITGLRRRKELDAKQEQLGDLLVRVNRALESLQPFQGIVQGETGKRVEQISGRLSAQLVEISALQGQAVRPQFYQLGALKTAIAELEQTESGHRSRIEEEERQIAVISEADRNVKQRITELKQDAPELDSGLQAAVKETGYELQDIAEDLQELAAETAKADQLELFDPIAAQEVTAGAQALQERIEQDLRDVEPYADKLAAFPGTLEAARSRIAGIIEQNSLHNMKADPYALLEQARAAAGGLQAPLRSGDMDEVRGIAAQTDTLLAEAVALAERQAQIRQSNRRDLEAVRGAWGALQERRSGLQGRIDAARGRFAAAHLSPLQAKLEAAETALRQGAAEVPQLEAWSSDERGEYEKARSGLDRLLTLQEDASRQFAETAEALDGLEERLQRVKHLFTAGQEQAYSAQQLLRSRGLSAGRFEPAALPEHAQLEQRLAAPPYSLDELESIGRSYSAQIAAFADEAARLIRQKEEAERQAQLAMLREQQRREAARRRNSGGGPGGFGGGGFGGGGRPGGGGRSSGGSSWGGGGRSSGGSSWGGGGKSGRNSGGSKW